jgi:hypothetical protein
MRKIINSLVFLIPAIAYADISLCDRLPTLVHINGINTNPFDADQSREKLNLLAKEKLGDSTKIKTVLAYNRTKNFFADIQQTFLQLKMQDPNTQDEKIAEALLGSIPPDMNAQVAEAAKRYYLQKQEQATLMQLTLDEQSEIIKDIKSKVDAGDKILLVPHSQGNLFANSTYTKLISSEGIKPEDIKIFGVASPADRVLPAGKGNGNYITSNNDIVIQSLAKIPFLNVLPRQLNLPISGADPLGHGFKEIYLNGAMAGRDAVWAGIEQQVFALNQSLNPLYQGKVYERAPIVMSFYGVPIDQKLWTEAGWNGGYSSITGYPHIFAPHREFDGSPFQSDSSNNYQSFFSTLEGISFADGTYTTIYSIMCKNYPIPDGEKIHVGSYKIHAHYDRRSRYGNPSELINTPSGFSIQTQSKFYNYVFNLDSLQRSSSYDHINVVNADVPSYSFIFGTMSYYLGSVEVTQDVKSNRYDIEWTPTPELMRSKVN